MARQTCSAAQPVSNGESVRAALDGPCRLCQACACCILLALCLWASRNKHAAGGGRNGCVVLCMCQDWDCTVCEVAMSQLVCVCL